MPWQHWRRFFGQAGDGVQLPFNFRLIEADWTPSALAESIEGQEAALPPGAWPNYVLQNHDRPRLATRLGQAQVRNACMLLLTLRGTATVYYGEELGLPDRPMDPARWLDPLGRDESRAPMPWDAGPGGGFSASAAAPGWLPAYAEAGRLSVRAQLADPDSVLNLYRRLIALRRASPVLRYGDYQTVSARGSCLSYQRSDGTQRLLVALNLGRVPAAVRLPGPGRVLVRTSGRPGERVSRELGLPPASGAIVRLD
jgi:alpha-glucosidase